MDKPDYLKDKGSAFWDSATKDTTYDAAGYVILENACRTVDIIDKLNAALASKKQEWVNLVQEHDHVIDLDHDTTKIEVSVVVNPLLGEIRQQRLALRQLIAHLRIGKVAGAATPTSNFWSSMDDAEAAFANS